MLYLTGISFELGKPQKNKFLFSGRVTFFEARKKTSEKNLATKFEGENNITN